MKTLILFLSTFFISLGIFAQECENYFPTKVGTSTEMTHYDAKGKPQSYSKSTVLSAAQTAEGFLVTFSAQSYDQKKKEVGNQNFTTLCKNGVFYLDMKTMMPATDTEKPGSMQTKIESSNMEIPSKLLAGQTLPDAWIKISMSAEGMPTMISQNITISNRIVEGFEKITTPAGTFDCVKMTYDVEMKTMFSIKTSIKVWYAVGYGDVRSETYDKKGKLTGYSELTSIQGN